VALDVDRLGPACALARQLGDAAGLLKVGSQLFAAEGPRAVEKLAGLGAAIFLDLKFHDIPNTVAGAVAAAAQLPGVRMLTVHTTGGLAMMQAAREAVGRGKDTPALLGVTLLTSLDAAALRKMGMSGAVESRVISLARLAKRAGLNGVVASSREAKSIRRACGPKFIIAVPGVRPRTTSVQDQARVATPAEAIGAGADYLIVGRPITGAKNPRAAALAIAAEIAAASASAR